MFGSIRSGFVGLAVPICASLMCCGITHAQQEDAPREKTQEEIQHERFIESSKRNFEYRMENQQYNIAIDIALMLHDLEPEGGIAAFNLARVFSQIGDSDSSLEWLQISLDHGFSRTKMLQSDRALVTVRARPEFEQILDGAEENRLAEFERIKEEFDEAEFYTFLPPTYDEKTPIPLIIALHGGGVDASDIFDPWINVAVNRGSILVAPNGPRPVGDGYAWTYADESEWIVTRTIDRLLEEGKAIDTSRIILTGFDEGATAAFSIALSRPHEIDAVIPIAGGYPTSAIVAPEDLSKDEWPSFYFMAGEKDGLRMSAQGVAASLRELGFEVETVIFPEVGHTLPEDYEKYLFDAVDWVLEH